MIALLGSLALVVGAASAAFALAMLLVMAWLIGRRRKSECRAAEREGREVMLSRELLVAMSGAGHRLPAFHTADASDRLRAVSHLLQLLRGGDRDRLLAFAETEGLFDAALARLRRGAPARRIEAMRVLEQFAGPACVQELTAALTDDGNAEVRLEAAATLARMGSLPPVADVLRSLELDRRPLTRLHTALFRSLAQRDAESLLQLAGEPRHAALRSALVDALGWSGDLGVVSALSVHACDPDPEVRSAVLRAARRLGHPNAGALAARLLDDPVEAVRVQAARTCGALGYAQAVPRLSALLGDPSWWVRARAAAALQALGVAPAPSPA